ncbi:MAG: class I SAM-dependent methyltransferase [Deltaproteobacteria bacterium]|nr:class I SAM-dependent methyltransferase [Deltaproteobacteria bacterium]
MTRWQDEVEEGKRFQFGQNWKRFLEDFDQERLAQSRLALQRSLRRESLEGLSFLDIGSGSGIHSLAARSLGARVHSFDYDGDSVACTRQLKESVRMGDEGWTIERGSALDESYVRSLGKFDIVYSWGVLHHTGDLWEALRIADLPVRRGGSLFLALYNDQGGLSRMWTAIKRVYVESSPPVRMALTLGTGLGLTLRQVPGRVARGMNPIPIEAWRAKREDRGMSQWTDLVDWVGGYPFEVARPEEVFEFYRERGYELEFLKTCGGGRGCNEYVLRKDGGSE